MIQVNWGGRSARIWLDTLPNWSFHVEHMLERQLGAARSSLTGDRRAAVELTVAVGARAYYGGLAAVFDPEDTGWLKVRVPVSAEDGPVLTDTLAYRPETARIGLLEDFADGALVGLLDADGELLLGSGTLQVEGGVQGDVGSFPNLFKTLGRILARLLALPPGGAEKTALRAILQEELAKMQSGQ